MNLGPFPHRKEPFTCQICGQPGEGEKGTRSHAGECREEANRRAARKWTAKRSRERAEGKA